MALSFEDFLASVGGAQAPLDPALRALWLDARGDWDGAHRCVDQSEVADAMWVHAFLHRKEGDAWNARYWYARAGRPPHEGSLETEWREIATALLAKAVH